jgi:hypothetical protein
MWRILFVPLGGLVAAGCASTSRLHDGRTALAAPETAAVVSGANKGSGEGFRRLWKSSGFKPWRFLKWDQERSSAEPGAPAALLQALRDEIGRLNQRPANGDDLLLTVTVYLYRGGGWFSQPKAHYELVARNQAGKAVWVADDEVVARSELARSLADPEEAVVAREIARRIRQAFGL